MKYSKYNLNLIFLSVQVNLMLRKEKRIYSTFEEISKRDKKIKKKEAMKENSKSYTKGF